MQSNNSLLSTITSNGLRFMMATTPEKNLWSLITKWSDDSASWKTNVRRQLALVTSATRTLEQRGLLMTTKVLKGTRGLFKVLKAQTYT